MGKKLKYLFIILICIIQLTGCKTNNTKTLPICWEKIGRAVAYVEKDVEKFAKLYKIEEEKMRLFSEEWVKNPPTVCKVEKVSVPTEEEISTYLDMTIDEIEKLTGKTILQNSFQIVFSFVGYFSVICLKDSSFYFLCEGYDTSEKPFYLAFDHEYLEEYLSTINMSQDMNFKDIMNLWGQTEIEETNRFEEYHYCISYRRNELVYEFIADNKEGKWFDLFIYQFHLSS